MNKNFSIKRVFLALITLFAIVFIGFFGYYIFNRTLGENEYCKALRKQEGIAYSYSCSVVEEYQKDGKTYIHLSMEGPTHGVFRINKETTEVMSEAWTDLIN